MSRDRAVAAAFALLALTFALAAPPITGAQTWRTLDEAALRRQFARPSSLPHPSDNQANTAKIDLGRRLFHEPMLSGNGRIACGTCHDLRLGLADGVPISRNGATGAALRRHTPSLWNLTWFPHLTWDGRADSLESQARIPLTHPDEMASSPEQAASKIAEDPTYREAFTFAFPGETGITGTMVVKALAAYERTLVSPPTRFDRWVSGDAAALAADEIRGLRLFVGKAQCANCHTGFAFTDRAFHDIGLSGDDPGRGPIIDLPQAYRSFKTPGLRELTWTAPYMHDGSLATLEDVVRHYERGGNRRSTRSKEMPRNFKLTEVERADLVAFLESLSSARIPAPSTEAWLQLAPPPEPPVSVATTTISQRDRSFMPRHVAIVRGQSLTVLNDDTRTHNVRTMDPRMPFNSGAQEPGESVTLKMDQRGRFEIHCGIHPTMRLTVDVD